MSEQPVDGPAAANDDEARPGAFRHWVDTRLRTAPAIYGLLVFTAFVSIEFDHATDAWDMLDTAGWTLIVFYIAHVFAHTLTDHGTLSLRAATWQAMTHAAGMLYAALPPAIVLVFSGLDELDAGTAYAATMWTTLIVLAILGYAAYARRGAHPVARIFGAIGTALLGGAIVLLEYAMH